MALIRTKLKQLRDADVRYISLVDRAATRIPFRVLKRDKETTMGIDLMGVFKSDDTAKPSVSALIVFAQKDEAAAKQIEAAIEQHGFTTNRVQKSDEGETLVFAQQEKPGDTLIVRLSDQMLVSVSNMGAPAGWIGALVTEHGFMPDLKMATATLYDQMQDIVQKSDTPQADAANLLTGFGEYLNQMVMLPTACYKLDAAITEIVKKCSCDETESTEPVAAKEDEKTEDSKEKAVKESPEEKKKRLKCHPPSEMAPVDEEDDQKPPPSHAEKADKTVLDALKGIEERTTAQLTSLSKKLEGVVTEQANQKKVLDDVVQKSDTLNATLRTTVAAVPVSEDRPVGDMRMRVQKDDDPRTGAFDTAFLRRRR